ncbi:hypothetical protein GCM10007111_32450 [Virgibacillus kapii]|uniref:Uncharacterized protein n=1 Tax=Virgibacillus kapii TaxID=1638645 RepID=A0ABQ2DQV4_9BACI|nr:hypothetical protein GCM10007111_32450 [Virgibacillus kapii]
MREQSISLRMTDRLLESRHLKVMIDQKYFASNIYLKNKEALEFQLIYNNIGCLDWSMYTYN